jgi:hypothetical protein
MGIQFAGDVGKDATFNYDSTDIGTANGGSSPIGTVGDVGKDNRGFSNNTSNHNPNNQPVPTDRPIQSPGNINN